MFRICKTILPFAVVIKGTNFDVACLRDFDPKK
jgi:hypothetical protein